MPFQKLPHYTYKHQRKCLWCYSSIPDQEHATTKFCPKYILPDGKKHSCKDKFNTPITKKKNIPFKRIADFHKVTHGSIKSLWKAKGASVTIADLNQYGIMLNRCIEWVAHENQTWTYYYVEFAVTQLPNKQYKISQHARIF